MLTYADVCPRMLTYAEKANQSLELRVDCAEKPLLISCANTIAKTSLFAIHTYIHTYIEVFEDLSPPSLMSICCPENRRERKKKEVT